jgi:radical SAM protein with 4Fe4S-binding SPASM domain
MCNHWRRDEYRRVFLTRERLLSLVDELAALNTRHVNWSGGEPTIRKDLPDIIESLSEVRIGSSIITNGTLITREYAERLLKARVQAVMYSLESAVPDIHDQVVGVKGSFQKLVQGARHLMSGSIHRPMLAANTVLTSVNTGPELLDLVYLAHELGISHINLSCVYTDHLNFREQQTLPPSAEQIAKFQSEYLPRMKLLGRELRVVIITNGSDEESRTIGASNGLISPTHIMGYYQHPDRSCYLPFYHCTIDYDGSVVGCCHMRSGAGVMGNIKDASLADILDSPAARELRSRITTANMPKACGTCAMQIRENQMIDRILKRSGPSAAAPNGPCDPRSIDS